MPIFQEPVTFDSIRHRSSFLLSTMLAIAAKYACQPQDNHADHLAHSTRVQTRSDIYPGRCPSVSPDAWQQIRGVAITCFFQAMISKVHCLGE